MSASKPASTVQTIQVNGQHYTVQVAPITPLATVLRDELGLYGTKIGCEAGDCGACTVLLDGAQVCACLLPLAQVGTKPVVTVEGLAEHGQLSRLQQAFLEHGAAQCGICTPGMLMAAHSLLSCNPQPDRQQVLDACLRANVHVPDEVALIGVDNDPYLCNLTLPPMTSVDVNSERIGYEAAKLLDRLMRGYKPPKLPVYLEPAQVVMRQSTDTIAVDDVEVATVVRFIRDHACDGITIEDAFAKVLVSRSTLTRRFKALLQRTPMAELTRVRLQKARQLLLETDLGIAQIAARRSARQLALGTPFIRPSPSQASCE